MSYSIELKKKLFNSKIKSNCCKRALAFGIIFGSVMLRDNVVDGTQDNIHLLSSPDLELAESAKECLSHIFKGICDIETKQNFGRREYLLYTDSALARSMAKAASEICTLDNCEYFKCDQCRNFFTRGVFLSSAALAEPQKQYHLEFLYENPERASVFRAFLEQIGVSPSGSGRMYYKNAEKIRLLLAYIGAKSESFDVVNITIARQIRNEENRITNCEAKNIQRSVSASMQQLDAITYVLSEDALEGLSEELQTTAKLRLENPDLSLSELAKRHDPPITKSGLTHRLTRIMSFAQNLKEEKAKNDSKA